MFLGDAEFLPAIPAQKQLLSKPLFMTSSPAPKLRVPILLPGPKHSSQPSTNVKRAYLGLLFWLIQTQPLHSPWSRTLLSPARQKYSAYNRELLTIYETVRYFWHMVEA
jgi:hypothetical protein